MGKVYKLYAPATLSQTRESLGQIGGSGNLEADIRMCSLQTIEPLFTKYLPPGGKVLEAGSGRGRWVFHLRRKGYDVRGIEIAQAEIAAAKEFDPHAPIDHGDVRTTGYPSQSFDAVISLGVVEHFEAGPQEAFREVRRIVKSGGLFFVTVPTQNVMRTALFNRIKTLQNMHRRLKGIELAFEEYRYTRRHFTELLREAGFAIVELAPDDFIPPLNMGLYNDSHFLQNSGQQWHLNRAGALLNSTLSFLSPWLHCSGTLWVCRSP
ncbi:MAG TPA: class I SAM-dependent methyltransferase [Bacteroidota bacterium]|nr:class I SAM-dependent methyltransferase [Bacteroidota bacterium]